ncbi:retrotransposon protein, putative, ty1-copia subclass [Tanacetum coccineum]
MLRADLFLRFFVSSIGVTTIFVSVLSTDDKEYLLEHPYSCCTSCTNSGEKFPLEEPLPAMLHGLKDQKEVLALYSVVDHGPRYPTKSSSSWCFMTCSGTKKLCFQTTEQELLQTVREFHVCKQEEGCMKIAAKERCKLIHGNTAGRVQKNQKNKPHKDGREVRLKERTDEFMLNNNVPFAPNLRLLHHLKKDNPAKDAICHNVGLRGSRKLKPGALSLYVGDGHRAAVEAIGTYHLELPSGLVIVLNNCHYAPSITRGVISVSRLFDDGFINRFDDNNVISVSKDNLVYFMAVPRDGIFEIDMSCSNTNDSSMYAITNKRAKINLDSSLLWHCRLGHISKKRIEKLQHDGLLNSIDIESLGKCVSCLSGKMARKPYSHQVERAKDLLGLIHTDVCGPFRIVSRQGASYFVTFTDDFSRYGYVYLLKHKHEVFETFKVFQKEVENQLGKTIKSLRSDRGGEYMSQEFLDHLKEHGIIAHRTPPYTPQNNGVSERRNRTMLDMVLGFNI